MKKFLSLTFIIFSVHHLSVAQEIIPLYQTVPNNKPDASYIEKADTGKDGIIRISHVSIPTITIYRPAENINQHTAIIICPGGGYLHLTFNWEGTSVAEMLVKWGITAIVLKYRLPSDAIMTDKTIAPLQDAQRAIQLTRLYAKDWNIDTSRIGIMGFSAGGHLAATASTHFDKAVIDNFEKISLRPDFSLLLYPVISMRKSLTHLGSRINLLGKNADSAAVDLYSNELQITPQTPRAFFVLAQDDRVVLPDNSIMYYEALRRNHIPAEIHIYQNGKHGFGLAFDRVGDNWIDRLKSWLQHNHYIH
jgi:acetyl esterase/lipase